MTETINLSAFCDEPGGRYTLDTPFVMGGWKYATDGRIMARVPAPHETDAPPERRVPRKAHECLRDIPPETPWLVFPKVHECRVCAGHGYISVPCHSCGQDTKESCACKANVIELGKARVSKHYAALIASLPKVEYAEPANATDPIRFRFDGGEGAICVMEID